MRGFNNTKSQPKQTKTGNYPVSTTNNFNHFILDFTERLIEDIEIEKVPPHLLDPVTLFAKINRIRQCFF